MAVRMSVGLDTTCCKRKINLTQLRRNTRSRRDKTSGRKRPRIEDNEVIAAPDSLSSFPSKSDQSGLSQLEKSKSFSPPVQPKSPTPPLRPKSPTPPIEPKSPTPPIRPKSPTPPIRPKSPTPPIQPKSPNSSMRPKSPKLESLNQPIFKSTRRKRKKIAYNNQPGNTEILANFDHLYAAIRRGEKLDDGHISAASKLLHKQFPNIQGLSTPLLGQNLSFPVINSTLLLAGSGFEYIQILHTGADHWVTICVVSSDEVRVYDSMFHSTTYATKKQIASIILTKSNQIQLKIGMTQFQENSLDCGIYAIAFATDLCHGNDPSQLKYDLPFKLRMHLLDSLKQQKMMPFPSVKLKSRLGYLTEKMNVYCKCRLLYAAEHGFPSNLFPRSEDIHMIQCYTCDEWYHKSCANLSIIEIKKLRKDDKNGFAKSAETTLMIYLIQIFQMIHHKNQCTAFII